MQHTVILALATMLAIVAVVFVVMLWRAFARSAWRQRLLPAGGRRWVPGSSWPGEWAAAQRPHDPATTAPSPGTDDISGRALRATLYGAGTSTAAVLHH
ncbi:MAG: hypothetical protein C0505_04990 [Leptothrix sp. (in: Bacteria)]|nr:hypothetical protein [Leptothrix sp. (in: b-proteobacteria)]